MNIRVSRRIARSGLCLALFCVLSGFALIPAARAGMAEGAEAYKKGDYATALKEWLPLAEQGNAAALYNVAQLYRAGKGVEKDIQLAERFYTEAAERGHVAAQGNLGTLYYFAFPNSPRLLDARYWWGKAAENGDARSQYMLGVMYFNGTPPPRDVVRGYAWVRLAAEAGLAEAVKAEQEMVQTLTAQEVSDGYALSQGLVRNPPPLTPGLKPSTGPATTTAQATPQTPAQPVPKPATNGTAPSKTVAATPMQRPQVAATSQGMADNASSAPASSAPASGASIVPPAVSAAEGGGNFYVQIAASGSLKDAEALKERTAADWQNVPGGTSIRVEQVERSGGGYLYKVQIGPFGTRPAANAHCNNLKKRKQNCFVVSG